MNATGLALLLALPASDPVGVKPDLLAARARFHTRLLPPPPRRSEPADDPAGSPFRLIRYPGPPGALAA